MFLLWLRDLAHATAGTKTQQDQQRDSARHGAPAWGVRGGGGCVDMQQQQQQQQQQQPPPPGMLPQGMPMPGGGVPHGPPMGMGMMAMMPGGPPMGGGMMAPGKGGAGGPMRGHHGGGPQGAPPPYGKGGGKGGGKGSRGKGMVHEGGRWGGGTGPGGRGRFERAKNDYAQHFVDTGLRPANFIRDSDVQERFEEYPKLKELIEAKDARIAERAMPPTFKKVDLKTFDLTTLGTKFDVIMIDPPWEEYRRRKIACGSMDGAETEVWTPQEIMNLRIDLIGDTPSFCFLWSGSGVSLQWGRACLRKWGYRRCEDISWIKVPRAVHACRMPARRPRVLGAAHRALSQGDSLLVRCCSPIAVCSADVWSECAMPQSNRETGRNFHWLPDSVITATTEHCLVGIKGTVRRNYDGHIIHANVDTDVMLSEEPPYGATDKPSELYAIIEHFANGRRRLELFGEDTNIRRACSQEHGPPSPPHLGSLKLGGHAVHMGRMRTLGVIGLSRRDPPLSPLSGVHAPHPHAHGHGHAHAHACAHAPTTCHLPPTTSTPVRLTMQPSPRPRVWPSRSVRRRLAHPRLLLVEF